MITNKSTKFSTKSIKNTDIPIEYVLFFVFALVMTVGILVFCNMNRGKTALPMAGNKRYDWITIESKNVCVIQFILNQI